MIARELQHVSGIGDAGWDRSRAGQRQAADVAATCHRGEKQSSSWRVLHHQSSRTAATLSDRITPRALNTAVAAAQVVVMISSTSSCSQGMCSSMLQ